MRKSFITNTGLMTISQVGSFVTAAVVGILAARYLGPTGKGQVALAGGAGTTFGALLCFGFDKAAPYFLARKELSDETVFGSWLLSVLVGTLITYGIIYPLFILYLMDNVFAGISKSLLLVGGLGCPLYFFRLLINTILDGHEDFVRHTYHDILMYIAMIIAAVLGLMVLHMGPLNYVVLQTGLGACTLIWGFFLLSKVNGLKLSFSLSTYSKMFYYGIKTAITQVFNLIDLRLDMFIVNYFTTNAWVGIYTVAGGLANLFWILPNSISMSLLPRNANSSRQEADERTAVLCRNAVWFTIISGALFLVVSRPIITFVYTEAFAGAVLAFALLMPGVVGQTISRICFTDCAARGFPEKATYSTAITASMTVVLDICLIPKYGIYGAAVASSIAYCTSGILGLYWHLKLSDNSLAMLIVPQKTDAKYYTSAYYRIKARFAS